MVGGDLVQPGCRPAHAFERRPSSLQLPDERRVYVNGQQPVLRTQLSDDLAGERARPRTQLDDPPVVPGLQLTGNGSRERAGTR